MKWIDGHLDLAYLHVNGRDIRRALLPDDAAGCVSLPALRDAGVEIAFATIFAEPGKFDPAQPHFYTSSSHLDEAEAAGLRQLEVYEQLESQGELTIVRCAADLARSAGGALPRIVLLMEGADPIRSPKHAQQWFDRGLRIVGLTWAEGTRYATGNSFEPRAAIAPHCHAGLTPLGIELVREFDRLGIVHDVSHLSDAAFDDVMTEAKGRVIASHSNCRALVDPKQRHLRDDQIKAIGDRGGIVGLNLYSSFLVAKAEGRRARIDDCMRHVDRVCEVMGHRRGVALGSDADGGFPPSDLPVGLDHPSRLDALAEALHDRGWSDDEIAGFAWGNWMRLLKRLFARKAK